MDAVKKSLMGWFLARSHCLQASAVSTRALLKIAQSRVQKRLLRKILMELTKGGRHISTRFQCQLGQLVFYPFLQGKQFISVIGPKIDNCTEVLKATELSKLLDALMENLRVC